MDYVTYGLFALAGGLLSHILFNRGGPGPFEKTLWAGLYEGKRVIVSLDDEAFIFELINNRLRITRGTFETMEDPFNGILADDMAGSGDNQSDDSFPPNLPIGKGK